MIFHRETTVSTNLDARAGRPGDVFTADFQTGGRGRLDHAWHSVRAENLMFSVVLSVGTIPAAEVATLPLVIGLAVVQALSVFPAVAESVALKWPNDVLCRNRKLGGILCERLDDRVIAGIGINVNQTAFPPDIADRAIALAVLEGRALDRESILQGTLKSIFACHAQWQTGGFGALYPQFTPYDCLKGRHVSVWATDRDPAPITGLCEGVQPDGSLRVGRQAVYAGEAHVHSF